MGFGDLSDLFDQFRPEYRWGILLVWNGLAVGGIVWADFRNLAETPISLAFFAAAGFVLGFVAFGLLVSRRFRDQVLFPGYSLEGYRFLLAGGGLAGALIALGAAMMLIGSLV